MGISRQDYNILEYTPYVDLDIQVELRFSRWTLLIYFSDKADVYMINIQYIIQMRQITSPIIITLARP